MAHAEPHAWVRMQIGLVKDNSLEQEVPQKQAIQLHW